MLRGTTVWHLWHFNVSPGSLARILLDDYSVVGWGKRIVYVVIRDKSLYTILLIIFNVRKIVGICRAKLVTYGRGGNGPLMTRIRFFGPVVVLFSYSYTPQKIGVFNRGWWYAKQCVCMCVCLFYSRREFRSNAVADEQVVPSVWFDVVDR